MGIDYATADEVREELGVSAADYPSKEDSGVTDEGQVDRWLTRAGLVIDERIGTMHQTRKHQVEILVAAHFGYERVSPGPDGRDVTVVESHEHVLEMAPKDPEAGPDGRTSPYWTHAVSLAPELRRGFYSYTN